ncbi:MAG: prolyl oligopeptidase family serine peptidase [Clostridia bacterium]|nr:prolyl oligopeptidase family serine peptidase [Clostridia bacterium]
MEKIITYETLRNFAYSNDHLIKGEIKGIVLSFFGLGGMYMHADDLGDAIEYAEKGIIYVIPYYNPWSWMNRQAVAFTDEIVSVLLEKYNLNGKVKVASTGASMGGLSALVYCAYAKITPCACVTNCPVCDLPYHFTERTDLPRTLYSAFGEYDGDLLSAMRSCSPIHLIDKMPNIKYVIFHCEEDKAVNIRKHSDVFVQKMKAERDIDYKVVPLRGHGDLSAQAKFEYNQAILSVFE